MPLYVLPSGGSKPSVPEGFREILVSLALVKGKIVVPPKPAHFLVDNFDEAHAPFQHCVGTRDGLKKHLCEVVDSLFSILESQAGSEAETSFDGKLPP
jgi:hypothetical protein